MKITILTGAGISAESGIQTFRASDGLWHEHRIEEVATPEGFAANPALVQSFYNERRRSLLQPNIAPNDAHKALATLEQKLGDDFLLVTQNIDDLHERGGSQRVIHMHGELRKVRCTRSGKIYPWDTDLKLGDSCACCQQSGTLRPHIVWFGEMPMRMEEIEQHLSQSTHFVAIGTSGKVYPAAGYVQAARSLGAHTLELNLEASDTSPQFHDHIVGPASKTVPRWVDDFLAGR
ncbi:MAG: Sir2 family NAD+-dependent deacetylase, partial [Granulosicoccaceae bacterium]